MTKITVIINTNGKRKKRIKNCLLSIKENSFRDFDILVVQQCLQKITLKGVRNINVALKGVGYAKNQGIKRTQGQIIVFTDDDCIVDKDWLKNIYLSFKKHKDIAGVFGKVLPYKPQSNKDKICPCTFLKNKKKFITKPCFHIKNIGFGNNMAFKREVFDKVGFFKNWLGPGSIGSNAEDAEFVLRVLFNNYKILYNPKIKAWHNRWLTNQELKKQKMSYLCGEVACYSYFAFQGKKFAQKIIINDLKELYWKLRKAIKYLIFFRKGSLSLFILRMKEIYFCLRGLIVGFYFSRKEPLVKNN